jgi:hypothetical protein
MTAPRQVCPIFAGDIDRHFRRFFDGVRRAHDELASFAVDPREGTRRESEPDARAR